jgi:hypothetical protein
MKSNRLIRTRGAEADLFQRGKRHVRKIATTRDTIARDNIRNSGFDRSIDSMTGLSILT